MHAREHITTYASHKKKEHPASKVKKSNVLRSIDSPIDRLLLLQNTIGNRAVQRLIKWGALQPKIKISQPNDKGEQEATVESCFRDRDEDRGRCLDPLKLEPSPVFVQQSTNIVRYPPFFPREITYSTYEDIRKGKKGKDLGTKDLGEAKKQLEEAKTSDPKAVFVLVKYKGKYKVKKKIAHYEQTIKEAKVIVNGVEITAKNATKHELSKLKSALEKLPKTHLQLLSESKPIIFQDEIALKGGVQTGGGHTSGDQIRITHTAMTKKAYIHTILHEMGHFMRTKSLLQTNRNKDPYTPTKVTGEYIEGAPMGEQVAEAYYLYLVGGGLVEEDKKEFDRLWK